MAKIESGATADLLTIDPTSKAARVTLYDAAGNAVTPNDLARGVALIKVRQSAATGAGAAVWAIRNPSTRTVVIKRLLLRCFFDGTAAATLMRYEVVKATAVSAFSGGAVVTPLIKRTALGQVLAEVRVLDTGLTLTGANYGGVMHEIVHGRVTQTTTLFASTQDMLSYAEIDIENTELAQNEALAIRNNVTAVVGDNIVGHCDFDER